MYIEGIVRSIRFYHVLYPFQKKLDNGCSSSLVVATWLMDQKFPNLIK